MSRPSRRDVLRACSFAGATSFAGCSSVGNDNREDDDDDGFGTHTTRDSELTEEDDTETREEEGSEPNSIEQMKQQYEGPDGEHTETVRIVNDVMREEYGIDEDAAGQGGALTRTTMEQLGLFEDDEVDAIGDRYIAVIDILTDQHGPYADLHAHKEEGNLDYGEQVREELETLLAHFSADTLEGLPYNPFGEYVVTQREDHQDAISRVRYSLTGAEAGVVMVDLNNQGEDDNLDHASNEVYGAGGGWSRKKMKRLVSDVIEI